MQGSFSSSQEYSSSSENEPEKNEGIDTIYRTGRTRLDEWIEEDCSLAEKDHDLMLFYKTGIKSREEATKNGSVMENVIDDEVYRLARVILPGRVVDFLKNLT